MSHLPHTAGFEMRLGFSKLKAALHPLPRSQFVFFSHFVTMQAQEASGSASAAKKAEKERLKAEKTKRFAEKQKAKLQNAVNTSKKALTTKQADELPEYVEATPKGDKKGL
jgi:hypothetical protein